MAPPVFLPGEFHGQRSLGRGWGGYSSWGCIESDVTEHAGKTALSLWMGNGGVGGAVINTSMV